MDAKRYSKIDELVDAALEMEGDERAAFLNKACADDQELRREVESLINACLKAEGFIEIPAIEVAARALAQDSAISPVGKTITHFEILSLLGAGGMGEVYLADDLTMKRKVALKLLPAQFTQSPDRIARFQRESRAASALNHPNIVTIYEIGQDRGINFIASEYIEGDTLRHRINQSKLTVKEAIEITIQVSSALVTAHAAGIIHRDIKPENIMIRRDGYVKVLDFGLAKLTEPIESDSNQSIIDHSTQSGTVLGTINYMSPEQARGQPIDSRTDLFSLGIVLYEMVTGRQPFKGATVASTFDAILNRTPESITSSNPDVSIELERIVNRALEKDRDIRYQTASDFRAVLKRLQRGLDSDITVSANAVSTSSLPAAKHLVSHWWMKAVIASGLLAILFAGAQIFLSRPAGNNIRWQDAESMKITDQQGEELFPSLAPDGKSLIYASRAEGNYNIYLKRIGSRRTDNLTEGSAEQNTQPAFSRDGKLIAFRRTGDAGGGIYVMTETGESVKELTKFGYNPAWSPDGKEIACTENNVAGPGRTVSHSRLWIVDSKTGESREIEVYDAVQASWSPNGQRIAYWGVDDQGRRDIWTVSVKGGEVVKVTDDKFVDWNPVWSPDGSYLYFISDRKGVMSLWRVAIDQTEGIVKGEPELVPAPSSNTQLVTFSSDGRHLAYVQADYKENIKKLDFDPADGKVIGSPVEITKSSGQLKFPAISPDGQVIVCQSGGNQADLFSVRVGNPIPNQLTDETSNEIYPSWSPDGEHINYCSNRNGTSQIYIMNKDGSGARQITDADAPGGAVIPVLSPDGARLAYSLHGNKSFIMDLNKPWREQTPVETPLFNNNTAHFVAHSWSPDGRYLAGTGHHSERYSQYPSTTRHDSRRLGLFAYSIETQDYTKISDFGYAARWLADSRRLIFIFENKIFVSDLQSRRPREIFSFVQDRLSGLDISKDNRFICVSAASAEADIWLLTVE